MDTNIKKSISNLVGESWSNTFYDWFQSKTANRLIKHINGRRSIKSIDVFPDKSNMFKALQKCSKDQVKVVILGQDPYFYKINNTPVADGLAFSSNIPKHLPSSLEVIFREIDYEYDCFPPYQLNANTSLNRWAEQGVLLLNTALTVEKNNPKSHVNIGWESFIEVLLKDLQNNSSVCYMLWGKDANCYKKLITSKSALILSCAHPAVHSYRKDYNIRLSNEFDKKKHYLGCNHFKKANQFLKSFNKTPIDWVGKN